MPDDVPDTATTADPAADPVGDEVLPPHAPVPPSVLTYVGLLLAGVVLGLFGAVVDVLAGHGARA